MKLSSIYLENFRGYQNRCVVKIGQDCTALVGRNDAGKSTILTAIDILFNDKAKIQQEDINILRKDKDDIIYIGAAFDDVPEELILDSSVSTSLHREELLNKEGKLEIYKSGSGSLITYIRTYSRLYGGRHLMSYKQKDLQKIVSENNIECDKTINRSMREAIRETLLSDVCPEEYNLKIESKVPVVFGKDDELKEIWTKLKPYLPTYCLFVADRKNQDSEEEIQDPIRAVLKATLANTKELARIAQDIKKEIESRASAALQELKEIDPALAETFSVKTIEPDWIKAFQSQSLLCGNGTNMVPLNLRGSGVRRLALLSFLRAESKRVREEDNPINKGSIIYAIEEPETSLHPSFQEKLVESMLKLGKQDKTQVILTTHSPYIVNKLQPDQIRIIKDGEARDLEISEAYVLPSVSLAEVSYIDLGALSYYYHDELYAYIDVNRLLNKLVEEQLRCPEYCRDYVRSDGGRVKDSDRALSKFVRNRIHHPENVYAEALTESDLRLSIDFMRRFIKANISAVSQ